jgi:tetratricopeptide (TPR) repeat protein
VRDALGDETPEADKRFAMETLSATSPGSRARLRGGGAGDVQQPDGGSAAAFFGRHCPRCEFRAGHAGMAIASKNMSRQQDAEKYIKEAIRHLDGMTERERYRTRGLFYYITGDYQQCVKEFGDLTTRYAADASARNNLALCLTYLRNMPKAVEEMRRWSRFCPSARSTAKISRSMPTTTAISTERNARRERSRSRACMPCLPSRSRSSVEARWLKPLQTFQTLGKIDTLGASFAASGLGDLAMYEGRFGDAARIYAEGADTDIATKDPDRAANKFIALASAHLARQQKAAAIAAAGKALENSTAVKIRFLAARVFVGAGAAERAEVLTTALASELLAEPQAYAKIVDGEAA